MGLGQMKLPSTVRMAALVLAVMLVAGLQWVAPGSIAALERAGGDLMWRLLSVADKPERRILIVDIDERSLSEVGAWPWSRSTVEQLSRKLADAGASAQVYDMVFTDARPGDAELAAAWSAGHVTLGQIFSLDPQAAPSAGSVGGAIAKAGCPEFAPLSFGYVANTSTLRNAAGSIGHITPRSESDGVVRSVPGLICHEDAAYPTLVLAALERLAKPAGGTGASASAASDWRPVRESRSWFEPYAALYNPNLPSLRVPLDERGDIRVPYWNSRGAFNSVSASDVLAGRVDPATVAGAVALVGSTAFGLADAVSTPLSPVASGLEVHAQLLTGLLDGRLPYAPSGSAALQWVLSVLGVVALLGIGSSKGRAPVKRLPLAAAAIASLFYGLALLVLHLYSVWLPWAVPALTVWLGALLLATADHGLTQTQRERISMHLRSYLPGPVASRLMNSEPTGATQFEQRQIGVLVADIRNFSAFAAHRPPEETAALLHAFCSKAVDIVEAHGGVVQNVVGDSVLAVWNAYGETPQDCAARSLKAAEELLRETRQLLKPTGPVHESDRVQPLALGIGLEMGSALVGSFGPQRRRAHAALGEPVSVATRLQAMTSDLSFPVLVGPKFAAELPAQSTESVGEYLLEGLSRSYQVYAPVGWADWAPSDFSWARTAPDVDEFAPSAASAAASIRFSTS